MLKIAYMQKPIFIVGSGKSGTHLLKNLFDFHPQLIVFPEELAFYNRVWPVLNSWVTPSKIVDFLVNDTKLSRIITGSYDGRNSPSHDKRNYELVDPNKLKNSLEEEINNLLITSQYSRPALFKAIIANRQYIPDKKKFWSTDK